MIAVVIPCYKARETIMNVLSLIGENIHRIYVVDDACPQGTGEFVASSCKDPRVVVLYNKENLGVGGAVKAGYQMALQDGVEIIVKIDADGQMNPKLIPEFILPLLNGEADYTKGNRFFHPESLEEMPILRKIGNAMLSFLNKFTHGYWDIMDPTNGYTAITSDALARLPLNKIENRYFFESDMLFRLYIARAVVRDVVMNAVYGEEKSHLSISKTLVTFPAKLAKRFVKRIIYQYFVRDFSIASLSLISGSLLFSFGFIYGAINWLISFSTKTNASPGTVMLSSLPLLLGVQLILFFFQYDIQFIPKKRISSYSIK